MTLAELIYEKSRDYRNDPFAFDNKEHLARNAGRPDVQRRIIEGRIRHIEAEIADFERRLEALRSGEIDP